MAGNIHSVLKEFWGFEKFREMQEEIIQTILEGKDTFFLWIQVAITEQTVSFCYDLEGPTHRL